VRIDVNHVKLPLRLEFCTIQLELPGQMKPHVLWKHEAPLPLVGQPDAPPANG
jgi:hypothetical protein